MKRLRVLSVLLTAAVMVVLLLMAGWHTGSFLGTKQFQLLAVHAFAQPSIQVWNSAPIRWSYTAEVNPEYMGSSETLFTQTVWIEEITLGNPSTSGTAVIHITDGNGIDVVPAIMMTAGYTWLMEYQARKAVGGVSWTCTGCTNVSAYMRVKY